MRSKQTINRERRLLLRGLLGGAGSHFLLRARAALGRDPAFTVYDALTAKGKPDLSKRGLVPIVGVAGVWRSGMPKDRIDAAGVAAAIRAAPTDCVFIDIEAWPLLTDDHLGVREENIEKYVEVAQIIRKTRPSLKFGFYGIAPICVYWPIVRQDPGQLASWRAVNRALRPLAEWVDFVLPSLYTYYDDRAGWRQFALATLEEARQYGKPVCPFLWNEYFDGNVRLRGQDVERSAWREELELCREHADGVVLWSPPKPYWNDNAAWWQSACELLLPRVS